jgi:hypothetical protein
MPLRYAATWAADLTRAKARVPMGFGDGQVRRDGRALSVVRLGICRETVNEGVRRFLLALAECARIESVD